MNLLKEAQKLQEAQALRLGIQIERKFSDDDLTDSFVSLVEAERDLHRALNAQTLIPFRVTVTADDRLEVVNVLAPDACSANVQIMEMLFGEFDAIKPKAIKIKVEPIKVSELRRAA